MVTEGYSAGFPHSDISGSKDICSSPKLFAAYHVFHRLLVPRHPPCALISLTNWLSFAGANYSSQIYSVISFGLGCLQNLLYCFPHDQSLDHMASDVLIFNWIINHFYSICGFQGTYLMYVRSTKLEKTSLSFANGLSANGDGEIRTLDPLLARQVLSQLSYTPIG